MRTAIYRFTDTEWVPSPQNQIISGNDAQLVLCFANRFMLEHNEVYNLVHQEFPNAIIAFCSTAGEIFGDRVFENSFVAVVMEFEHTPLVAHSVNLNQYANRFDAAVDLAKKFAQEDLNYIMVLSDGSQVNGSELVGGLNSVFPKNVLITGGLAGDDARFSTTLVGLNKQPRSGEILAIGFYGNHLEVTHGSHGGWDVFGLEKRITKADLNILYEIENVNALELYKKYLGDEAKNLPGSALLFPLHVTLPGTNTPVVRTILSINEEQQSMTFAGDIPVGSKVRFMKANFDRVVNAAAEAAGNSINSTNVKPDFALLISCVGRKLILGEKTENEIKAINTTFENQTLLAGFYSYGEISPFNEGGNCQLHNQTMTITAFYEKKEK